MMITGSAYDPDIIRCPWAFDAQLRRYAPVYHDQENDVYLVSGYELMTSVIQDTVNFSNRYMAKMVGKDPFPTEVMEIYARGYPMVDALLVTDGAQHDRHRKIISKAFSRQRMLELTPLFEQRVAQLFGQIMQRGQMRFRADIAELVPMIMTQYQLRISEDDMPRVIEWSRIMSSGFSGAGKSMERLKYEAEQVLLFQQYFEDRLRFEMARIARTGEGERPDDLLTLLAHALSDPDKPMTMAEAMSFLFVLLPATHDTTTGGMLACMHRFVAMPGVQQRAAEDPATIRALMDEAMRHEAPVRQFWRRAINDVTLAGVDIPAGSWVLLRVSAANRDERVFDDPDRFDPERRMKRPYLTFGSGIHTCVGRPWALHIIGIVLRYLAASGKVFTFTDGENDFDHEIGLLASPFVELAISFHDRAEAPLA